MTVAFSISISTFEIFSKLSKGRTIFPAQPWQVIPRDDLGSLYLEREGWQQLVVTSGSSRCIRPDSLTTALIT